MARPTRGQPRHENAGVNPHGIFVPLVSMCFRHTDSCGLRLKQVGAKLFFRNAGNFRDLQDALGGNAAPGIKGRPLDAKQGSKLSDAANPIRTLSGFFVHDRECRANLVTLSSNKNRGGLQIVVDYAVRLALY